MYYYNARRLLGSLIIESVAYRDQISLAPLYIDNTQNISVKWIIWLLLSLLCRPKAILLSGWHCILLLFLHYFCFQVNSNHCNRDFLFLIFSDWIFCQEKQRKQSNFPFLSNAPLRNCNCNFCRLYWTGAGVDAQPSTNIFSSHSQRLPPSFEEQTRQNKRPCKQN